MNHTSKQRLKLSLKIAILCLVMIVPCIAYNYMQLAWLLSIILIVSQIITLIGVLRDREQAQGEKI